MKNKNKGYINYSHFFPLPKITEECSVQCRRCLAVWTEEVTHSGIFAGYARYYDFCDKCKTPEDVVY